MAKMNRRTQVNNHKLIVDLPFTTYYIDLLLKQQEEKTSLTSLSGSAVARGGERSRLDGPAGEGERRQARLWAGGDTAMMLLLLLLLLLLRLNLSFSPFVCVTV